MADNKQYGVPIQLIEQFRRLQATQQKRRKMPFIGTADVCINNGPPARRLNIQAENGVLSISPFPLKLNGLNGFHLPRQELIIVDTRSVCIKLDPHINVTVTFATDLQKEEFIGRLGDLNMSESSSSSSPSNPSNPSSPSSSANATINLDRE